MCTYYYSIGQFRITTGFRGSFQKEDCVFWNSCHFAIKFQRLLKHRFRKSQHALLHLWRIGLPYACDCATNVCRRTDTATHRKYIIGTGTQFKITFVIMMLCQRFFVFVFCLFLFNNLKCMLLCDAGYV